MTPEKNHRSKEIVRRRDTNPRKWTFKTLGVHYNITPSTAFEIYHRTKARKESSGVLSKYISKKYPKLAEGRESEDLRSVKVS